jgi:hypothetical protein
VSDVGFAVAFIAMLVVLARLILFAVGQAIGQPISLQDAWTISRGNGLALAATIILVQVPLWLAGTVLTNLLLAIGFGQGAPLAMLFIGSVLQSAAAVLHAIVLATVFRQLVGIRV